MENQGNTDKWIEEQNLYREVWEVELQQLTERDMKEIDNLINNAE